MKDALILAPIGRDAAVASSILVSSGFTTQTSRSLAEALSLVDDCLCFVTTQEALLDEHREAMAQWLERQPAWSDYPIILLTLRGAEIDERLAFLENNVVALERPFGPGALTSAVRAAVRARRRQLEVKAFLDERVRTEERQRLLIRELHHRVKNTLSNVQSVLGATARSSSDIDEFYRTFSARIQSLARTHTFLTDDYWQTASLKEMLEAELEHFAYTPEQVTLDGPAITLVADLAVPLGMAIHELASNAAKYGALSEPAGRLSVSWLLTQKADRAHLHLTWSERDGPPASKPQQSGFGSVLLERVLKVQCEADVDLRYDEAGFTMSLVMPLRNARLVPKYELTEPEL